MPRVVIVIVCYNGIADTLECLASLSQLTYLDVEVVVVDNASKDDTAKSVREQFPKVHVLEPGENLGFAGGNNVGIRYALDKLNAAYCFLLNNDTTVEPGLLEPLVAYSESHPDAGVVGPAMCYYDHREILWAAGGQMDERARSRLIEEGQPFAKLGSEPRESDFIVGCGMLIRRDVWEKNGLFDDRYFLYFEESDLCFRMRKAGLRCVTVPTVRLWHKVSRSTGGASELTLYYMRRNSLLFLERYGSIAGRTMALTENLRQYMVWILKGERRYAEVLGAALADYFARRFGRASHVFR
jgi:GT2 family glycosyltransferase